MTLKLSDFKLAVNISRLELGQAYAVRQLLLDSGWQETSLPSPRLLYSAGAVGHAWVATSGERVIGFLRIVSDGEIVSYIAEVVVAEDWRGRGIGQALAETALRRYPSARLDLLSTEMATGFYERAGFTAKPGYRRWP